MTFASSFGRVFSPTFQPKSQAAADDLSTGTYVYDIQMITASSVTTLTYGKLIVSADVTRLVA